MLVAPADAANALGSPINARRRLELRGEANGVTVYDDFAHHPTAILATLAALRGKVGGTARIIAVLEPRSNTMKMGICKDDLAPSLGRADEVFLLQPAHIPWQVAGRWQKPAFSLHTGVAMWIRWQIWW